MLGEKYTTIGECYYFERQIYSKFNELNISAVILGETSTDFEIKNGVILVKGDFDSTITGYKYNLPKTIENVMYNNEIMGSILLNYINLNKKLKLEEKVNKTKIKTTN